MTQSVTVDLGTRSYDILIGANLLARAGEHIAKQTLSSGNGGRVCVVTDETVHGLHYATLEDSLKSAGLTPHVIIRPPGEGQKCFTVLERIIDELLEIGFERNDTLIAFGGGVIGDLTGFAASVFKRGCKFIQIPTTLLSQVDSSVGGKTAINTPRGKNLVGAFYQPELVLTDTSVLSTLPEREMKAGYAEVLKYGLLGDAKFFEWLEDNGADVLAGKPAALSEAIAVSCQAKADIVARDERERGERALLNLGHTFGHALEAEAGYDGSLLHGEAVSAGMLMAFEYSGAPDAGRVATHMQAVGLTRPGNIPHLLKDPETLMTHMSHDKKNEAGALTLILARKIGEAYVQRAADTVSVRNYLAALSAKVQNA